MNGCSAAAAGQDGKIKLINTEGGAITKEFAAAPIIKAAGPARPVSVAFFGGRLEYARLKLPAMLFVMLVVQASPGDHRNWDAIRSWAGSLPQLFNSRAAEV